MGTNLRHWIFTGCPSGGGCWDHLNKTRHLVMLTGCPSKEVPLIHRRTQEVPANVRKKCGGEVRKGRRKQNNRVMSVHMWLNMGKIKRLM